MNHQPEEPYYLHVARVMLSAEKVPRSLVEKLDRVEKRIKAVKPGGSLCSTQAIGVIIEIWEDAQ